MTGRTRFLTVFTLGFCACLGASWFAVEPMRDADTSWQSIRAKLEQHRVDAETLDPDDPRALESLITGLSATEELGEARRDAIANSFGMRILISFLATGIAYWIAVSVSGRLAEVRRYSPRPRTTTGRRRGARVPERTGSSRVRRTDSPEERVFIANQRGMLEYVNDPIVKDLGRPRELLIGTSLAQLFGPNSAESLAAVFAGLSSEQPTAHLEASLGDKPEPTWLALDIHARFTEDGQIAEIVGYGQDITRARRDRQNGKSTGTETATETPALLGSEIVLVDPGRDSRRLMEFYLNQAGAKVCALETGSSLLGAVTAAGSVFQVAVIDRRLGDGDGLDFAKRIREGGFEGTIALLTQEIDAAEARFDALDRCLLLQKPLDRRTLVEALGGAVADSSETVAT